MTETVGAGQSDVEIVKVAHSVVVVVAPGMGDEIQALKAGIMEIGDIFVVNKADRENADKTVLDIRFMLEMSPKKTEWTQPVIKTVAIAGGGIRELLEKINQHRKYLDAGALALWRKREVETELIEAIKQKATEPILRDLKKMGKFDELINKILTREIGPDSAADIGLVWHSRSKIGNTKHFRRDYGKGKT